jgi:hypothetical protein
MRACKPQEIWFYQVLHCQCIPHQSNFLLGLFGIKENKNKINRTITFFGERFMTTELKLRMSKIISNGKGIIPNIKISHLRCFPG